MSANDANFREKGNTDLLGFRRISTDYLFVAGFLGSGFWVGTFWVEELKSVIGNHESKIDGVNDGNSTNLTNWQRVRER